MYNKVIVTVGILIIFILGVIYNINHKDEIEAHNKFCREHTSDSECRGWKDPNAYSDTSGDGGH